VEGALTFAARRLATAGLTLVLASLLVFGALALVPGDPAVAILGIDASPDTLAALRGRLGLDRPFPARYAAWLGGALTGDLGLSIRYDRPVASLVAASLRVTFPLVAGAGVLALAVAVPLGTVAAIHRGRALEWPAILFAQAGLAVPTFWTGLLLILVFGVRLGWLPTTGFVDWRESPLAALRALALPLATLALGQAAILTRLVRASVLETLGQEFVRTARAKGAPEGRVVVRHALRTALLPVLTVSGVAFAQLLAGAIVVESVFALPALGRLALTAVEARDLPLVQGIALAVAALIVAANLLVDLAAGWLDPRVRHR
jgi:peptide/nickel transport system permease protein